MTTINLTQALCLTLVHSLWQGFLAAVAAGIIILCTRKSKAAVRYNLLTADLVLLLLVSGFTLFHELDRSSAGGDDGISMAGRVSGAEETTVLNGIQLQVHAGIDRGTGIFEQTVAFLHQHASTVVMIWMLCLLGQLVQLMAGLYQMGNLRKRRVFAAGAFWQERLQELAARLGINKTVDLLQSAKVNVPATFGFLKPSILVPLGMLSNLPPDQVEAILLHELAHIRRNDYLANLLLHITEAVFFFNPGVRWLASLIREEREACCDDMVLMGTADRNSYFDALVAFRENTLVGPSSYALQLGQGKTDLLWRIRRMLNQENKKLHIMEKAILSFGLTAILVIGLISMRAAGRQAESRQTGKTREAREHLWQGNDTLPVLSSNSGKQPQVKFPSIITRVEDNGSQKKYKIDATDADGNTFQLTKVNGEVTELVINGKTIPEKDFDQYLYIFEEIENRNHETAGEQGNEDKVAAAERELEKAQERLDAVNQEQVDAQQRIEEEQEKQQEKLEEEQQKQQEKMEKDMEKLQEDREKVQEEAQQKAEELVQKQQEEMEKQQEANEKAVEKQQEDAEREATKQQEAYEKQQEAYEKQQEEYARKQEVMANSGDHTIRQIIRDMIDLGLVESTDAVHSFRLDNNGLTLNGARQSADAYQALRVKYIKNAIEHYSYSHNNNGTTVDVKQDRN